MCELLITFIAAGLGLRLVAMGSMDGVKPIILTSYHYSKALPLIAVNLNLLLFLYLSAALDTVGHDKLLSIHFGGPLPTLTNILNLDIPMIIVLLCVAVTMVRYRVDIVT